MAVGAFRAGAMAAARLPAPVSRTIAERAAIMASHGPSFPGRPTPMVQRRRMVATHLERVYGPGISRWQLSRRTDEAFASYARYWAESLRLPSLSRKQILAGIEYDRMDLIEAGLAAGRGVILALPHLGGWEWAGTHLAMTGHPISVVVERLDPPDVYEWFVAFREKLGMQVIPMGPGAAAACSRALADNHLLCLLSDRVVGDAASVEVEFFGERTRLPAGPATLALRSGATLIPCAVFFARRSDQHRAVVRPPLELARHGKFRDDVQAGTQALAHEFEGLIRQAPTQWHLMQPNWPSDTPG